MFKVVIASIIVGTVLAAVPAHANHDTIYSPCGTEYGFIHMTYEEWAAHITTMEADGVIPPGMVFRYYEKLHGGKGDTVLEDGTIPAWDTWAYNLTDGQILSIDDWANGNHPKIEDLMFSSGLIPEWILDANMMVRRFNDPYWSQANPMTPSFTVWQSLCMANYGYSIPVMEINEDGVWESNIPTTTTIAIVPTTTQPPVVTTTQPPVVTTTTTTVVPDPLPAPPEEEEIQPPSSQPLPSSGILVDYDLFDAEWDGYPFEQTILLLEERYPPGTPGRFHFRLSTAVEFLRNGGMVKGLDNLWDYGS
jgi:hypothetical protein